MDKLRDALERLEKSKLYPFHMPGHKRREIAEWTKEIYSQDITEIDGFDNLHHPEGIIKEEQEFAAKLFGAEESYFLVNGSTSGVLAAIKTVVQNSKDCLLMSRNAHKSAYNGLYLSNVRADYLYPINIEGISFAGEIAADNVEKALEKHASYAGIFITSPTYEGIVSDIEVICKAAHKKGIPVIVDEAHGAHLGIFGGDGYFPSGALTKGADIVIQSLHKTLPAMTQTAILHVQGNLVDRDKLRMNLGIFQTSSPSYVLMKSISSCLHFCKEQGGDFMIGYKKRLQKFYQESKNLSSLQIINKDMINNLSQDKINIEMDPGKIIIGVGESGLSGRQLYDILREKYHLQMEMAANDYVIAMTSIMDTDEGFERLISALYEIDGQCTQKRESVAKREKVDLKPEVFCTVGEALEMQEESVIFAESAGRISQEFVFLYPPGIPLIVPGERISAQLLEYLEEAMEMGLAVQGPADLEQNRIKCIHFLETERVDHEKD